QNVEVREADMQLVGGLEVAGERIAHAGSDLHVDAGDLVHVLRFESAAVPLEELHDVLLRGIVRVRRRWPAEARGGPWRRRTRLRRARLLLLDDTTHALGEELVVFQ